MTDQTILIVEDDDKIRTLLRNVLEGEGFSVLAVATTAEARVIVDTSVISLITLDIHLGQENGLEFARELRQMSSVPIIMVTGRDDVIDRVVGLEIGADDYITKPFHVREVIARVRSVLRRTEARENSQSAKDHPPTAEPKGVQFKFDGLTALPDQLELRCRAGGDCELTSGDFKLLNIFLNRPKRVLSRDQLMDLAGGHAWFPTDRTIDNQIARLRKKIERDPANPKLIKTVRGIGYTFACDVKVTQLSAAPANSA